MVQEQQSLNYLSDGARSGTAVCDPVMDPSGGVESEEVGVVGDQNAPV